MVSSGCPAIRSPFKESRKYFVSGLRPADSTAFISTASLMLTQAYNPFRSPELRGAIRESRWFSPACQLPSGNARGASQIAERVPEGINPISSTQDTSLVSFTVVPER